MRITLLAIPLALLALPALAGDLRQQVLEQLGGIEDAPTQASLSALGPGVAAELMELAEDTTLPHTRRARALHALGWFPSEETHAVLTAALDGQDALFARKAAYALANGWGERALDDLSRALSSDDVQLRIAAANALGNVGTEASKALLDQRLPVETVPAVRETIEKNSKR